MLLSFECGDLSDESSQNCFNINHFIQVINFMSFSREEMACAHNQLIFLLGRWGFVLQWIRVHNERLEKPVLGLWNIFQVVLCEEGLGSSQSFWMPTLHWRWKLMKKLFNVNIDLSRAVVVTQLVERLLLIPEVRSLNPVICKKFFILNICLLSITVNCVLKRWK